MQNILCVARCSNELEEFRQNQIKKLLSSETGWDRVKRMYISMVSISPELSQIVWNCTTVSLVVGFYGALSHMQQAKTDHLRKNVASVFESQHLARRKLQDTMTLSGIKGGFMYALRYGSFSSLYLLLTMTAANYNNKITVWEHIASGTLLGSIFRINYGLKGMTAAGVTGGFLG
ncbi:RPII140-upstream gene protein-like [Uloborus diversus]|uniref:RPII140-upstream gene protein-like n=1 Tax=Uloborus diversus TaxID=327109 RepID=UPI00240A7D11|nr:RPII140-upstream gene protein-like [Uloborus diversus]